MLHTIDDQGNISWHCHTPTCAYHNCQGWDRGIDCQHHQNQQQEPAGQTLTAHLSDPDVQWVSPNEIRLPACPNCGSLVTLRVHSDEELVPPIVTRDEQTGEILQVAGPDHPGYNKNLWQIDADVVRKRIPHPTLAHLTPGQIEEKQAAMRNNAPDVPVDWMLSEHTALKINSVAQHPAVARHQALAEQLKAAGKVYQAPVAPESSPEQVYTRAQVEEIVNALLQQHGVITSPRLPAIPPPEAQ